MTFEPPARADAGACNPPLLIAAAFFRQYDDTFWETLRAGCARKWKFRQTFASARERPLLERQDEKA